MIENTKYQEAVADCGSHQKRARKLHDGAAISSLMDEKINVKASRSASISKRPVGGTELNREVAEEAQKGAVTDVFHICNSALVLLLTDGICPKDVIPGRK